MSGKDLSKTVPTVPTNKHLKHKHWPLPDSIKLFQLHFEQSLSFAEIGRLYGTTKQAVYDRLHRLMQHLPNKEQVEVYKANKPAILNAAEMKVLGYMLDDGKLEKANLNNTAYTFTQLTQARRLEEGKSTVNIGLKTTLVEAAQQHNDIDVSPKRSRDDKPRQEGQEEP